MFRWIVFLVLMPPFAAAGEIYQCTAADGSKTFQATPCPDDSKEDRKKLQSAASASRPESRASVPADDGADKPATSCRSGVLRDFEGLRKEIEAYYKKRTRQCGENFHSDSSQIENCYQEQKEIRVEKHETLEKQKGQSLARCDS